MKKKNDPIRCQWQEEDCIKDKCTPMEYKEHERLRLLGEFDD